MKILLVFVATIASTFAIRCDGPYKRLCFAYKLEPDAPLEADFYDETHMVLRNATGTIGEKTFSLYPDAESLTIYASNIDNITDGALCSPPKLRTLHLNYNKKFPNITSDLLKRCTNITNLKITKVEPEPDVFIHVPNLMKLEIAKSRFGHLTKEYFEPLKQLKELTIANSEIEKLDPGVLCLSPSLEKVHLENLRAFPSLTKQMFEGCDNIKELHLSFAGEGYLTVEKDTFSHLKKLEELTLKKLDMSQLTKDYLEGLTSLDTIYFEKCNISKIEPDAFDNLEMIKELRFQENSLTDLAPEIFDSLKNLELLDLSDNKLSDIDDIKALPKLAELILKNNLLSKIDVKEMDENFPNLLECDVRENKLDCDFSKNLDAQKLEIYLFDPCS